MSSEEQFRARQAEMPDKELSEKCRKLVSDVCKDPRKWTMTVPPQVDDSDMILCELIRRFNKLTEAPEPLVELDEDPLEGIDFE